MRASNVIGALFVFILAVVLDYAVIWQIYEFIDTTTDGQMRTLILAGLAILTIIITIVVPILMATQSETEVAA